MFHFLKIELEQKRNFLKNLLNNFDLAWQNDLMELCPMLQNKILEHS